MVRKTRKAEIDKIVKLAEDGFTNVEISKKTKRSLPTIRKYLKEASARVQQQVTIEAQQKELEGLRQRIDEVDNLRKRVDELEKAGSQTQALNRIPTQCDNGHEFMLAYHCNEPTCPNFDEQWISIDGQKILDPNAVDVLQYINQVHKKNPSEAAKIARL